VERVRLAKFQAKRRDAMYKARGLRLEAERLRGRVMGVPTYTRSVMANEYLIGQATWLDQQASAVCKIAFDRYAEEMYDYFSERPTEFYDNGVASISGMRAVIPQREILGDEEW
jgi:hypothetical protein